MTHVPVYGKEHTFLEKDTGLLFRNSSFHETAALHTHNFYEFFIVTDGTALHMVNDSIQSLAKGDFVFIRPQDVHTYEFYCSEDFRIINIGFSTLIFQSIKSFLDNSKNFRELSTAEFPKCVHVDEITLEQIKKDFLKIGQLMNETNTLYTIYYAKNCLSTVFANYFFHYTTDMHSPSTMPDWFSNMLTEMQKIENLQAGFPRMLELAACSKNHLCRVFQKHMNMTPTEYINDRRLEYSIYLLTQTSDDILDICSQCGFHNLSHFYHLFKEKYHTSPARFKKTTVINQ